jgi:predicted CXXCH cytochrome family protein
MSPVRTLALALAVLAPAAALASGGHDGVGCTGCHAIHTAKGEIIFAVPANAKYTNPKTGQAFTGPTALCLGCHQDSDKGGQGYAPVSRHASHPFGLASVNPKIARVPNELLREGGRFECISCHDPHPSNPNYKYLRVNVGAKADKMDAFCGLCHGAKSDATAEKIAIFDSMDEMHPANAAAAPAKATAVPLPPAPPGTKKK